MTVEKSHTSDVIVIKSVVIREQKYQLSTENSLKDNSKIVIDNNTNNNNNNNNNNYNNNNNSYYNVKGACLPQLSCTLCSGLLFE